MRGDNTLHLGALVFSLCLHAALFTLLPRFQNAPALKPITFEIEFIAEAEQTTPLQPPDFVPPEPVVEPQIEKPITPRNPTPQVKRISTPSPVLSSESGGEEPAPSLSPVITETQVMQTNEDAVQSPAPAPMQAASEPAPVKSLTIPIQSVVKSESDEATQDEAWSGYGELLHDYVGKHKQYPQIAIRRNLEGTVTVSARISQGRLIEITLVDSSGHKVLDEQALKMVRKAVEELPVQANLARKSFTVLIPVDFRLEG